MTYICYYAGELNTGDPIHPAITCKQSHGYRRCPSLKPTPPPPPACSPYKRNC